MRARHTFTMGFVTAALVLGPGARPLHADDATKKEAWRDCMTLCILVAFWPPGVAAWAAGCTAAYTADRVSQANAYTPRFDPSRGFASGMETILFTTNEIVSLGAGRWAGDVPTGSFLLGQGNVTAAQFFVTPGATLLDQATYPHFDVLPWMSIGVGTFNPANSMWELAWNTAGFNDPSGYALRVDFVDASLPTPQTGVNAANNVANVVPEPATVFLLGAGLFGLVGGARLSDRPTRRDAARRR